jgi:PAS domain S-box-containing protein
VQSGPSPETQNRHASADKAVGDRTIRALLVRQHELIEEAELGRRRLLAQIAERTQAEAKLRESEERYRLLFEQSIDGVFIADADGHYVDVSPAGCEMFGLTRDEFLARSLTDLLAPEEHHRLAAQLARLSQGQVLLNEWRFLRKDGSVFVGELAGRQLPDGRMQGVVRDITERKQSEEALRRSEEALREGDRRKDEFLAMLAHELRNPLAPIRAGLELIRLAGSSAASVERVRSIMERQVGHMVRLIDDLLDVSRITSGKIQLHRATTPLADLVNAAIEANRAALDTARIELRVDLPDQPCLLYVDPTRIVQVLSNLLHNAGKFTPSGGHIDVCARCRMSEISTESELELTVSDDGIGIATDMLPRVFELFAQAEQRGAVRSQPGLGIGLALAQRLVEMHGGRIEAASKGLDQGSTFRIVLPITSGIELVDSPDSDSRFETVTRRVLVIDDNEDAAGSMALWLEALGSQVRIAHDGESAVRAIAEFRPDVVLLDIGMPGMDGYETCRRIRFEPFGSDVFIVALTGWGQEQDKVLATKAGFDAHLTKPADPAVLERILSATR